MAKTDLDDLFLYGVDTHRRRIYFGDYTVAADEDSGAFHQRSTELAVRAFHLLESSGPGKPIELHMNSGGGDAYAMLRLHDTIIASPCQVKFFGSGIIMSAATWIMVACDERYLHPNTTVMLHDGSEALEGNHTDVMIGAGEAKRLQDLLYGIYAQNSRLPESFWADVCQRDVYLTAQEAVALGLADKTLEPKKRGNLRKMRQAALKKNSVADVQQVVNTVYARINRPKVPKVEMNRVVKEPEDPNVLVVVEASVAEVSATKEPLS